MFQRVYHRGEGRENGSRRFMADAGGLGQGVRSRSQYMRAEALWSAGYHCVPCAELRDTVPNPDHLARAFHAERGSRESCLHRFVRQQLHGPHKVMEVEPCGAHPDLHLAAVGSRACASLQDQVVR